ncbi:hypothetical protein VIGAN_05188500, partial [Vigna angularis var. angularis]
IGNVAPLVIFRSQSCVSSALVSIFIRVLGIFDFLYYAVSIFIFASRLLHLQPSCLNFSIFVTLCHFAISGFLAFSSSKSLISKIESSPTLRLTFLGALRCRF